MYCSGFPLTRLDVWGAHTGLFACLAKLSSLTRLRLEFVSVSWSFGAHDDWLALGRALTSMHNLQSLTLDLPSTSALKQSESPIQIKWPLPSLTYLQLHHGDGNLADSAVWPLFQVPRLRSLNFEWFGVGLFFPIDLSAGLPSLTELSLSSLYGAGCKALVDALTGGGLRSLARIRCEDTRMGGRFEEDKRGYDIVDAILQHTQSSSQTVSVARPLLLADIDNIDEERAVRFLRSHPSLQQVELREVIDDGIDTGTQLPPETKAAILCPAVHSLSTNLCIFRHCRFPALRHLTLYNWDDESLLDALGDSLDTIAWLSLPLRSYTITRLCVASRVTVCLDGDSSAADLENLLLWFPHIESLCVHRDSAHRQRRMNVERLNAFIDVLIALAKSGHLQRLVDLYFDPKQNPFNASNAASTAGRLADLVSLLPKLESIGFEHSTADALNAHAQDPALQNVLAAGLLHRSERDYQRRIDRIDIRR